MRRALLLIALGWTALACAPATAALLISSSQLAISPSQLALTDRDLPGFAKAKRDLFSTTSAFQWGHGFGGSEAEAKRETEELIKNGFVEAVETFFTGRREAHGTHREAVSDVLVFETPQAAAHELATNVSEALSSFERAGRKRFSVPSIPGSKGIGNFRPHKRGADANVFFATGRCFAVVGNAVPSASTWAQGRRAPVTAAVRLYRRARGVCA